MTDQLDKNILWNKLFGFKEYAFDLDGNLILKNEYETDSPFAWAIGFFNPESNQFYIASKSFIKQRKNLTEFITLNENSFKLISTTSDEYKWISNNLLNEPKLVENNDLFMLNSITEQDSGSDLVFAISIKQMKKDAWKRFVTYITKVAKYYNLINYEPLTHEGKHTLKLKFNVQDDIESEKIVDLAISLVSLIPLFVLRMRKSVGDIWADSNFLRPGYYFNLFMIEFKKLVDPEILNKIDFSNYTSVFKNTIFLNEDLKKELVKFGYKLEFFEEAKVLAVDNFFRLDLFKNSYNEYILKLRNNLATKLP
ncbi:hypothetical protein EI74_0199 [Mycoplasma testudineum]|uniref:Uncharacterized protein n=1 Tax=Mycoplasma testudineum TaxID=244584 RepID=A0A4R6IH64_9MOLU|nr:hypothetical protein [Mycoplasma testudineum]OYD27078.1 hypothetical protein CG473_00285 [Mycoplasma testudineum]TDO21168.1 hypothetical protein EI74_0199 [Mycoplasma testudineum]